MWTTELDEIFLEMYTAKKEDEIETFKERERERDWDGLITHCFH